MKSLRQPQSSGSAPLSLTEGVTLKCDYNGNWRERPDPVVVERRDSRTYVYPETAQLGTRSPTVIYSTPGVEMYMDRGWDSRWDPRMDSRY